ncbi:hypothetical protein FN976_28605 [Caenimonas sedimenti]|uniref:Uncharacterized protein n=1 Tax=Caenimonas sedimenti TaxID=2596921 RepID=A0A562ZCR0_9BURK|nr:hypothetical protein [Caenimonas sedimenti]TWO63121.1 hypothetical protein FN976_28605 [Caenimonas sedimenti]
MPEFQYTDDQRRSRYLERCPRILQNGLPPFEFARGWDDLAIELLVGIDNLLNDADAGAFELQQLKEKFGVFVVHFWLRGQRPHPLWPGSRLRRDQALRALVSTAREKSKRTCMACGTPGLLRESGWMRVSCDQCEPRWGKALRGEPE